MATILEKKYTSKDDVGDIIKAIKKLAKDKSKRVLLDDECEWLETKLKEIARLINIVEKKVKNIKSSTELNEIIYHDYSIGHPWDDNQDYEKMNVETKNNIIFEEFTNNGWYIWIVDDSNKRAVFYRLRRKT